MNLLSVLRDLTFCKRDLASRKGDHYDNVSTRDHSWPQSFLSRSRFKHFSNHCLQAPGRNRRDCRAERERLCRRHWSGLRSNEAVLGESQSGEREARARSAQFALEDSSEFIAQQIVKVFA